MTLSAPQSRRGIFSLSLVILAALVALAGALLWISSASAAPLPNTTIELDQSPDGPGTVAPGAVVSYTSNVNISTPLVGTDELTIEINYDSDLLNPVVNCGPAASASSASPSPAYCNWDDPVAAGTYLMSIQGLAGGNLDAPSSRVCADADASSTCNEGGTSVEQAVDVDADRHRRTDGRRRSGDLG